MSQVALERLVRNGELDAALRPSSVEDAVRNGARQFFALAAEVARGQFDPSIEWEEFVQALWEQVDAGFGVTVDERDSEPSREWFQEAADAEVVVWDPRSDER